MKHSSNAKYKKRILRNKIKDWKDVLPKVISDIGLNRSLKVIDAGAGYGGLLLTLFELNCLKHGLYVDNFYTGIYEELFSEYKMDKKYFEQRNISILESDVVNQEIKYKEADLVIKMWLPHTYWKDILVKSRPSFILTTDSDNDGLEQLGYKKVNDYLHCSKEKILKDKDYFKFHGFRKFFILYGYDE